MAALVLNDTVELETLSKPLAVADTVKTPRYAIRLAIILLIFLLLLIPALMFAPWRQTVYGNGQVMAFNPTQRPQFVTTAVEGVIVKWFVYEGQRVKRGDKLVQLRDNDADILLRLQREKDALDGQIREGILRVADMESRIRNFVDAKTNNLLAADNTIAAAEFDKNAVDNAVNEASARFDIATIRYKRFKDLVATTDVSRQEYEVAELEFRQSTEALQRAKANLSSISERIESLKKGRLGIENTNDGLINGAKGDLRSAVAALQQQRGAYEVFNTRYARQDNLEVLAPTDGVVFRLLANGEGNQFVRAQERLARIVPDVAPNTPLPESKQPAQMALAGGAGFSSFQLLTDGTVPAIVAELNIDGNDLPLLKKGDRVLLQFEGWAAVQFAAYPNAATGTFEGKVFLVDPTADDKGHFRVLVEPAAENPNGTKADPWPNQEILRQGVRAQGWFLLEEVSIGYEMWRLLNGFPVARPLDEKSKTGSILGPVKGTGGK